MSDHDTISPETDDEIRARLRAFAQEVMEHADTEVALRPTPRRSRPPTISLVAIAACLLAVVGLAAVVMADRQSVDTTDPSDSPTQTTAGLTTLARGVVEFVEAPVPSHGGNGFLAGGGLSGQTLDITAEEEDGEVTGQARMGLAGFLVEGPAEIVVEFECADTSTGDVVLGGTVTKRSGEGSGVPLMGVLVAVIIREGEPDRATLWWGAQASSCPEFLESVPVPITDELLDVIDGDDIETGG
jgi:hypothetical protein